MPASAVTKRLRQYQVAKNAWQETAQNQLTTTNAPQDPPPNLNGVLWKEDFESAPRLAHSSRLLNWLRSGDSQQQANQEGLLQGVLLGQDTFYGDPGQVVTFGVTERRRDLWQERLLQFHITAPVDPVLTGQDTFYGDPGQVPTLQERWIVPKAYPRANILLWHEVDLVNTTLVVELVPPGLNGVVQLFDFESAVRSGITLSLRYRQHQAEPWAMLLLTGQDAFYGDPGQAPTLQERWVVPRGYPRANSLLWHEVNLVNSTLLVESLPPGLNGTLQLFDFDPAARLGLYKVGVLRIYDLYVNPSGLLVAVVAGPEVGSLALMGVGR
jgi:hypothetical protein